MTTTTKSPPALHETAASAVEGRDTPLSARRPDASRLPQPVRRASDLHTPGPWTVDDGGGHYYGIFDANGAAIAYLVDPHTQEYLPTPRTVDNYQDGELTELALEQLRARQGQANAYVFAAAPDLMAALRMVYESNVDLAPAVERAMIDALAKAEAAP